MISSRDNIPNNNHLFFFCKQTNKQKPYQKNGLETFKYKPISDISLELMLKSFGMPQKNKEMLVTII